jgi:hypothetical protein
MLSITFLLAAIILCKLCWLYIYCNMPSIAFLLAASSPPTDRGNSSMGHAWLLAELTMKMEQHKVEWIVSRVQVTNPPQPVAACTHFDVLACNRSSPLPMQEQQHLCQ